MSTKSGMADFLVELSGSRPTTVPRGRFVSPRLTLILGKRSVRRWPRRTPTHPLPRWGQRLFRRTARRRAIMSITVSPGTPARCQSVPLATQNSSTRSPTVRSNAVGSCDGRLGTWRRSAPTLPRSNGRKPRGSVARASPARERSASRRKPSPLKEVLQAGHAACIPGERVEKPTDNRPARSLCCRKWLMLIPKSFRPVVGPGALRHTPPALGPTTITRPRSLQGTTSKDEGRVRGPTARGRHDARPIRHSVGRKVAGDNDTVRVSQTGHSADVAHSRQKSLNRFGARAVDRRARDRAMTKPSLDRLRGPDTQATWTFGPRFPVL